MRTLRLHFVSKSIFARYERLTVKKKAAIDARIDDPRQLSDSITPLVLPLSYCPINLFWLSQIICHIECRLNSGLITATLFVEKEKKRLTVKRADQVILGSFELSDSHLTHSQQVEIVATSC
jgi:hypothetical protein